MKKHDADPELELHEAWLPEESQVLECIDRDTYHKKQGNDQYDDMQNGVDAVFLKRVVDF